jgi:two-component system chemotaxis response regulator CheY
MLRRLVMRILIVDDEPDVCTLLKAYFSEFGDCDIVYDGIDAVEAFLLAINSDRPYDLISLDIMMPSMSGREALKRIKEIESDRGIRGAAAVKVIMVSVLEDMDNIAGSFKDQCEAYVTKPFEKIDIINALDGLGIIE